MIDSMQVVIALCTVLLSVVGFILIRAVKAVDQSLSSLTSKVDGLAKQDTHILVELASLRARVTHLEFVVHKIPLPEVAP